MFHAAEKSLAPIVMISYNRPDWVRLSLNNVALAHGAVDHEIFMFIDGPRNKDDKVLQDRICEIAVSYQQKLPKLSIIRRDHNFGCRGNIVDAISTVIRKYGKVIVIEDDVLVSRTFLEYMDDALIFYKDDKSIWSVNAYQSPELHIPKDYPYDIYLNPINLCWGWGTWKDRWEQVDFDLKDWPIMCTNSEMIARLNKSGRHILGMIESQFAGRLRTWDVQCTYHVIKHGLMSVEPRYQLSKNIGFSSQVGGEHFKGDMPYLSRQPYYNFRPRLVGHLTHDLRIFSQFEWIAHPRNLRVRIFRKVKRMFAYFRCKNLEPKEVR